jgi:hypothetical protein
LILFGCCALRAKGIVENGRAPAPRSHGTAVGQVVEVGGRRERAPTNIQDGRGEAR